VPLIELATDGMIRRDIVGLEHHLVSPFQVIQISKPHNELAMLIQAEGDITVLHIDRAVSIGREGHGVVRMVVKVGKDVLGEEHWR
jgi:hypothetical protein